MTWITYGECNVLNDPAGRECVDLRVPEGSGFAALAIESGCEWVTFDRDYVRFPGLKWHVPRAR
jgi:hypothetical protein